MDIDSKLMIAAISAGSAIAGALVTQLFTVLQHFLERKHRRLVLLREKYEQLASLVSDSHEWIGQQMKSKTLADLQGSFPEQAKKAMVLAHIYFPKLHSPCESYVNACAVFQAALVDNHEFNAEINVGTQAVRKNPEHLRQVMSHIRDSRQRLDEAIVKYASKYAKA